MVGLGKREEIGWVVASVIAAVGSCSRHISLGWFCSMVGKVSERHDKNSSAMGNWKWTKEPALPITFAQISSIKLTPIKKLISLKLRSSSFSTCIIVCTSGTIRRTRSVPLLVEMVHNRPACIV